MLVKTGVVSSLFLDVVGTDYSRGCRWLLRDFCQNPSLASVTDGVGTREHQDYLFSLFVGLRKVYDSVSREALWMVLVRCGVP